MLYKLNKYPFMEYLILHNTKLIKALRAVIVFLTNKQISLLTFRFPITVLNMMHKYL